MTTCPRALSGTTRIALALCVPLALLLTNLYLVASPVYIRYEYSKAGFPASSLYGKDERLALAEATLQYMRSDAGGEYLTRLQSQGRPIYNAREVSHLIDAKRVMRATFALQALCTVLSFLAFFAKGRTSSRRAESLTAISRGCLAFLAFLTGIGLLAYANFNLFFTMFHRLFFTGDSWLFPRTDSLIELFPVTFWMDATFILAGLTLIEYLVVALAAHALSLRFREAP